MDSQPLPSHLKHNLIVNILDGAFFGLAIGFASYVTVIPLFVNSLTDSATLVGLVPAIHAVGWQLPQLFTAARVTRLRRVKPMVMWMTVQERLPFIGMAIIAWFVPSLEKKAVLLGIFFLLIWQGLGAGVTANPWQIMISRLIPSNLRGTFFGLQAAAAYLFSSGSAIAAGWILEHWSYPTNYVLCFLLASIALAVSLVFLGMTKEMDSQIITQPGLQQTFWKDILRILREEVDFRGYLLVRMLLAFATLAFAFYTVYAVRVHGVSEARIGLMTGIYMGTQIAANPILGWLGDRFGHRPVLVFGVFTCIASALIAWIAPSPNWFFLVFILAGISNVSVWTIGLAITLEFGNESEKPAYVGLINTLVAPATIAAPLLGGWLADRAGYQFTFGISIVFSLVTLLVFYTFKQRSKEIQQ